MGRKPKKSSENAYNYPMRVERAKPIKKQDKKIELVDFAKALLIYKKSDADRAVLMKDSEAIRTWAKKKLPSLRASQEEWSELLNKF